MVFYVFQDYDSKIQDDSFIFPTPIYTCIYTYLPAYWYNGLSVPQWSGRLRVKDSLKFKG